MTEQRQAEPHILETSETAQRIKRRGLIAGAAALVVGLAARTQPTAAYSQVIGTNNYGGALDTGNADGVQGYSSSANNAGVFGRNNDSDGTGVFGIAANGVGVFGQSANGPGLSGHSETGVGAYAESQNNQGFRANSWTTTPSSNTQVGVFGRSYSDAGVFGIYQHTVAAPNGVGVIGVSSTGVGVAGKSPASSGVWGFTANTSYLAAVTGVGYLPNTNPSYSQLGGAPGIGGQSGSGSGVQGVSASGYGAAGISTSNHGVYGASTSGYGVYGTTSTAGVAGVWGNAGVAGAGAGTFTGPVNVYGNLTATNTATHSVYGAIGPGSAFGVAGVFGNATVANCYGVYGNGTTSGSYAGYFVGPTQMNGVANVTGNLNVGSSLYVSGGSYVSGVKSAVVPHPDGSHRALYCVESPEAWFEDFGEANLAGGAATVALDPDFAAVVDTSKLYVFLTPHFAGGNGLAVTVRTAVGFTVAEVGAGKSAGGFAYRVVAKRKDVAAPRLAKITLPVIAAAPTLAASPTIPSAPTAKPVAPPALALPPIPHHVEEDEPLTKPTGAVPGNAQVATGTDGETAFVPATRL